MTTPAAYSIREDAGDAVVDVDESIYEAAAVMRAAYWLTDRAYVLIQRVKPGGLLIRVRSKNPKPSLAQPRAVSSLDLAGELANALLDHQLREEVSRRTHGVREMLLEKALLENAAFDEIESDDAGDPVEHAAGRKWPEHA